MLDSRKRMFGGAVIAIAGLGTALLFRKPAEEPHHVPWPAGFTEVRPSAPLANPAPPEPVQPRLAGRIESLAEAPANPAPSSSAVSIYQLPGSANTSSPSDKAAASSASTDPFLRVGSVFAPAPENNNSAAPKVYALSELRPLVDTGSESNTTAPLLAEPAKLNLAQQSAATGLAAPGTQPVEHSTGYRWTPNRSNIIDPPSSGAAGNPALTERPSLLAPPPMSAMPSAASSPAKAPASGYTLPRVDSPPSLAVPNYSYGAPAPAMTPSPFQSPPTLGGAVVRHRIEDGDTLPSIARRYYGDELRARELFESNRGALRDPELLPIGTELVIPGGSPQNGPAPTGGSPMSQVTPPLLTPPAMENFGPRTLAVSTSSWRGAGEPAANIVPPAGPLAPVALSPWDQQLANAAPLNTTTNFGMPAMPVIASPPAITPNAMAGPTSMAPTGWPPAPAGLVATGATAPAQVGWPPRPAEPSAGNWPARAWNTSESAMNWVGDKLMGTGTTAAPTPGSKTHLVRPLETWETLAQRFYGDARHATTLQAANRAQTSSLKPGTVIVVPTMPL